MADMISGNAEDVLRRWEDVAARRQTFQSVWQEIADNLLGRRDFTGEGTPGRKRMARIYDTTGLQAADLLAAALHSFLTNPALRWFTLRAEAPDLADIDRPADMPWDNEFEGKMLARMHAAGLTNEQARALVEGFSAEQGTVWADMQASQARAFEDSLDALRSEWGRSFNANLDLANRAFNAAFGERVDDARRMRLADGSYLGDHPDMVRAFAELGQLLGEAEFVGPASGQGSLSRDQARNRMADLESDPDFRAALLDRAHPDHRDAVARRSRLAAQAYAEREESVADMRV